jgi:predicted nucleic-acid-binding Zn-ribbon protein
MDEKLPKFSWYSRCAKCGNEPRFDISETAETEYRSPTPKDEYLLRTCRRCGYTWKESCVEEEDG